MSATTEVPTTDLPANTPAPAGETPDVEPASPPPQPAPKPDEKPLQPWQDRRIANITRERREAEQRAETARQDAERFRAELELLRRQSQPDGAQPPRQQSAEDIAREAEQRAVERLRIENEAKAFNEACNRVADKARTEFGAETFQQANAGWGNAGLDLSKSGHRDLLALITSQDDGHKIYTDLGKDPDFVAHVLEMSPVQAAFAIARRLTPTQAAELKADAQAQTEEPPVAAPAPPPRVSSAPRPAAQPAASRRSPAGGRDISDPDISMDDFVRQRSEQVRARRGH